MRLPLDLMLRDAAAHDPSDLSCHVMALVAEVKLMAEACAVATNHLDTYGTVTGGHDREMASQAAAFTAMDPFTKTCGHRFVSVYAKTVNGLSPSEPTYTAIRIKDDRFNVYDAHGGIVGAYVAESALVFFPGLTVQTLGDL